MKKNLCYFLIISMLIVSSVGCGQQTKESDKKETKIEKTDKQDTVSDGIKETEDTTVTETTESTTSNENSTDTKSTNSTKQENTKSTTTKQTTSQSNKKETTQNNTQNSTNNKQNNSTQSNDSKHKHKYSQSVTKPTCTEQGFTTYSCDCGDSYKNNYTSAKGHTEVIDKAVAATSTSTGLTEGKHCSVCGEILIAQTVTDKIIEYFYTRDIKIAWNYRTGVTYGGDGFTSCDYQIVSASCTPNSDRYILNSHSRDCSFTLKIKVKCMTELRYMRVPYIIKDSSGNILKQGSIYAKHSDTGSYARYVTYTISTPVSFPFVADTYTITLGN